MLDFQEKFLLKSLFHNNGKGNLQFVIEQYRFSQAINFYDVLNEKNNLPRWINLIRKAHQSLKDKELISGFELGEWSLTRAGFEIAKSILQINPSVNKIVLYGNEQTINEITNKKAVIFETSSPLNNSIIELLEFPIQGVLVIKNKSRLIFEISKLQSIKEYLYLSVCKYESIEDTFNNEGPNENTLEMSIKNIIYFSPTDFFNDDDDEIPSTVVSTVIRRIRDTSMSRELKKLYNNHCQICGNTIVTGINRNYSEAHHLKPLGNPHYGPDIESNLIVLCPNHHAEFDAKSISLNPDTLLIEHIEKNNQFANTPLKISLHTIDVKFISYHHELFKKNT